MCTAENTQTAIIYDLIKPKKNPKIVSKLPKPVYFTALLIPLFKSKTIKITITKMIIPRLISKTYSLSIIPSTKGLVFGKRNNVKTYANNHLLADNKLNTKPFDVHLIKDKIIKIIKIKSKINILFNISIICSVIYFNIKRLY